MTRLPQARLWLLFAGFLGSGPVAAAEISSNGLGGGLWSSPATWHGKVIPGPGDDVVIQKNDVVAFDRNDDGKVSCKKLLIDPRGGLTFKTSGGKLVLTLTEGIESYGVIRIDGTKSASDDLELRLAGKDAASLKIKLGKGGALLLYGRAELPGNKRNVRLATVQPAEFKDVKDRLVTAVEADGNVMIDWLRAELRDVRLEAKKLDNTGNKANEKIQVKECRFLGHARFWCQNCDTPEIVGNTFNLGDAKPPDAKPVELVAINVSYSPLATIRGNAVGAGFLIGITINYQSDSVLMDNTVEQCGVGIQGGYGIPNTMIKQATIRGCKTGVKLEGASGVLEDVLVEGAETAFHQQNANLQLVRFGVKDLAPKGQAVLHEGGTLTLLECRLKPGDVKIGPQGAKPLPVPVMYLEQVVVGVKGAPADTLVEVRTAKPAPAAGAADPNVRNSPAPLVDGLTPGPKTLNPLIVKSWSLDVAGKTLAAPEYTVNILGAAAKEDMERPVLKTAPLRLSENPAAESKTPTLEVNLK